MPLKMGCCDVEELGIVCFWDGMDVLLFYEVMDIFLLLGLLVLRRSSLLYLGYTSWFMGVTPAAGKLLVGRYARTLLRPKLVGNVIW